MTTPMLAPAELNDPAPTIRPLKDAPVPAPVSTLDSSTRTKSPAMNLTFIAPPPGFHPHTVFDLTRVDGAAGLFTLEDTSGAELRLFLVEPRLFVPDYAPELTNEHLAPLGAEGAAQVDVFVVATIEGGSPVVNLLAPILVNPATGSAAQVILDEAAWPLRAELIRPAA